jgi:integrase/recombinase XerC
MDTGYLPPHVLAAHLTYLAQLGRAAGTIEARRRALERMATRMGMPLLDATPADVKAWREALTVTGNTVKGYVSHAQDFYAWAVREGLTGVNPADGLPLPRLVRGLPRPIGEGDLMEAVLCAPPRVRPWLALAGWAGLRAKEIALLRRERVLDTASPPVLLVASDATKGRRERVVPASEFVLTELRVAGMPRAGWMFTRRDGRAGPNTPAVVSHEANRHLHACGIAGTLHCARHRFATVLLQQTHDLRLVQELLGHQSPESTAIYTAYDQGLAVAAVEALPVPAHLRAVGEEETAS